MSGSGWLARNLAREIHDERVIEALATVPRAAFVPRSQRARAYEDAALPIGRGQTISQPTVVARMLELLELSAADRVLDVGTGSGYHAVLLSLLSAEVFTIERHRELSARAEEVTRSLGVGNVTFVVGDGSRGLPAQAPFDAINVAAAVGDAVPEELVDQLGLRGRLVAPLGDAEQRLVRTRRTWHGLRSEVLDPVRFVPLVRGQG